MPVPDPSSGSNRWSVDFLLGDQDATPTFVECKRFNDARSRREVVGQVLEYAANGHYYWTTENLREYAEAAAKERGRTLDEMLLGITLTNQDSPEVYFDRMVENLREGQIRIIFFLEEAPMELRSLVDFLNKQMERSEVLLVEAQQFQHGNNLRIVVPSLFGYTEQARQVKRTVSVSTAASRRRWDRDSFFSDASSKLLENQVQALRRLFDGAQALGCEATWGTGKVQGSFTIRDSSLKTGSLISVFTDGRIWLNFGSLHGNPEVESLRNRMKDLAVQSLGFQIPDDFAGRYPSFKMEQWGDQADTLVEILHDLVSGLRESRT
jgi:hypothetical protein